MRFVVYHRDTTRFLRNHPKVRTDKTSFATEAAAKSALTREVKNGAVCRDDFLITDLDTFNSTIEKTVTVTKHGDGSVPTTPYEQSVNTPLCCDPRSETYWSM